MFTSVFDADISKLEYWSDLLWDADDSRSYKPTTLEYVIRHVFSPVHHPRKDDYTEKNAHTLALAVHTAACAYSDHVDHAHKPHWFRITKMLQNLQAITHPTLKGQKYTLSSQLNAMKDGDMLVSPALYGGESYGLIFQKQDHRILYQSLHSSKCSDEREKVIGPHPDLPFAVRDSAFDDEDPNFRSKHSIRNLLIYERELHTGTPHGVCHSVEPRCITKRSSPGPVMRDRIYDAFWTRSQLWFLIRFAIQSSLDHSPLGRSTYKFFMLFFMCNLANHVTETSAPNVLLHSMSAKVLRRFRKLDCSVPQWLYDTVSRSCTRLSMTLDERWRKMQATQRTSPLWHPSSLDLIKDMQLSLPRIDQISLANRGSDPPHTLCLPNCSNRDTLDDLLHNSDNISSRGGKALHHSDIHVKLYDVEQAVGDDLDDWFARVTNIDEACKQLECLTYRYQPLALDGYGMHDPEGLSIMLLTTVELWVALDKLVVKEIPILADYSPEVSLDLLRGLHLRGTANIHRFCRMHQYLLTRHALAHRDWSVFSNEFTEYSFPCRYYDNTPHVRHLKARIKRSLPINPLHAKIIIFELQCPVSFDIWRSVTCWISGVKVDGKRHVAGGFRIHDLPALVPHILSHSRSFSLYSDLAQDRLCYEYEGSYMRHPEHVYILPSGPYADSGLQQYLNATKHMSNEVLAAQVNCDPNLSLHEFIAFAHLRSGGSLQWCNIFRELRSRTLDFRHQEVYLLLAQASTQVGPLDSTEDLLWHRELRDASFCRALLNELESLFVDIGAGSQDGPAMATISLLAGVLSSRSSGDVSRRAIELLRKVRRKTYDWVHELLYDVMMSPTSREGLELLRDMAAVCRSTFDVAATARYDLFRSELDIEIALSCVMLVHTTVLSTPSDVGSYSRALLNHSRRLSLVLESSLKDAIQADTTDLGVDRAVQVVWPGYRPSPRRWRSLQPPNSRWLLCETAPTSERCSQKVHVNLLDGSLLVDGKPISDKLPSDVTSDPIYRELFGERDLMVVTSDLPGMDFVTMSLVHGCYVHFSIRKHNKVVIRAQRQGTNDIYELIPRQTFDEELPTPLVAAHVHWLNLSTSAIEIRPVERPWEHSLDNWIIQRDFGLSRATKGHESLVNKQSPTWTMVSRRFVCLDSPENLLITVTPIDATESLSLRLSVTLPRYGLSFFINENNDFESRDFKDMVYDEDQCVGTLFGLVNRLVLRPKTQTEAELIPKHILIPHSSSLHLDGHDVHIKLPSSGPVRYYTYQADSELGCLKGIASLESRLYLARLHFLTSSGCRPDPLTGRTGVEEAISLVWLAGTRQGTFEWSRDIWQSPQIRFALQNLQGHTDLRNRDSLLQEAQLFPSEVVASVQPSKGFLGSLHQLLHERSAPNLLACITLSRYNSGCQGLSSLDIDPLRGLFSSLRTNGPPFQSQYISRLHNSAHHFQTTVSVQHDSGKFRTSTLRKHYVQCRTNYVESLNMIKVALRPQTEFERVLDQCGQWPRITPYILFRCLAATSPIKLPESWKKCLISLTMLALDLQRARRLLRFALENLEEEFCKELENEGCDGWDPAKYPDWLLIQLQGDFFIRRVQADIAKEMMSPRSGKNVVIQVHMGEGKSSVIIPICAAVLADGSQLVRVIVPKALIPQTIQVLTGRLCGLVNKSIYHLTFSRDEMHAKTERENGKVGHLHVLASKCRDECGIIVTQPEHVLSLKLGCLETQLLKNLIRANTAPTVQKWGFKHLLHLLTGSLWKSLVENTHVSSIIGGGKRWHQGFEIPSSDKSKALLWDEMNKSSCAETFLELQKFLETHTRDLLDESDEVLRPQFQSVYAVGHQRPLEGSPDRWTIVQKVLGLVKRHAYLLSTPGSHSIRCDSSSPGSFPHIHILQVEGGERLISLITQDVLDGRLPGISLHSEPGLRGAIHEFILRKDIHPDSIRMVEKYARQSTIWSSLLLLRGLLAHNILLFVLKQRRWRVDYGLDPNTPPRTMLAIPYRAKDVPTDTAEFGHPDITILLTCLSYYHRGLSQAQLRSSFELLLQQDSPSSEYALWLEGCNSASVPYAIRRLDGVNIRSLEQWHKHLVPLFSRNKRTIDLYLSKIVFPNHAKEFALRILGSYWDISEEKNHLVTGELVPSYVLLELVRKLNGFSGFSGTNDGQYLLPTSISEDDPSHLNQTGTNARVLAYLLQPENSSYVVTADESGERWTTLKLLSMVATKEPQIRVLLDVGAQILDLSNIQMAKAWLDCTSSTETAGAIYFSEDDKLMVLTRNGTYQSLSSSPLAQQLHRCVAYLDEAHTRGTDLKFPLGFRAAVTLGHKVTKDRLVQGCMRMRKLGNGHSVMFFAPHEVDQRIRGLVAKENQNVAVTTADILHWAIHETWSDIQRQAPYWAHLGMVHKSRHEVWSRFCQNKATPEGLADAWIEPELKSLADMYMPCKPITPFTTLPHQVRERCESLGVLSPRDVRMDEEQEREVSRQIEREREIERPPRAVPAAHSLHTDVIMFVKTGIVPSPSWTTAVRPVFTTTTTSRPHAWSPYILATADFCETIKESESVQGRKNDYLRPVQWVLSGKTHGRDVFLLLSPYEADRLMPEIRISEHVHLHLYIPRTTKRMKPTDDLRLYSIPPLPSDWIPPWDLIDQLNVFAGQLYLSDYASYVRVCHFLGIYTESLPQKLGTVIARNWFSNPDSSDEEIKNRFEGTPLPLVMQLLAARRGTEFAGTHMGRILDGWPLTEEDFQSSADVDKMRTGRLELEQPGISEGLVSVPKDNEQTTNRKRVLDLEPAGPESKRRWLN